VDLLVYQILYILSTCPQCYA